MWRLNFGAGYKKVNMVMESCKLRMYFQFLMLFLFHNWNIKHVLEEKCENNHNDLFLN